MAGARLVWTSGESICSGCAIRLARPSSQQTLFRSSIYTKRKLHHGRNLQREMQASTAVSQQSFMQDFFSANTSIDRGWLKNSVLAVVRTAVDSKKVAMKDELQHGSQAESTAAMSRSGLLDESVQPVESPTTAVQPNPEIVVPSEQEILPHRRRRRQQETGAADSTVVNADVQLPLDASSQLTTAATTMPQSATLRKTLATYLSLTKPRLSFLILLTTTSAYSLYPIPEILSASAAADLPTTLSTSTLTLLFLTTGTFLSCACANTLNMLFEPKYDALMTRTRNRPLVRKLVTPRAAAIFAFVTGATGLLLLDLGTNHTVAGLSALNIFLYAGVYTPMKRLSPWNTWVGAIVGGIPPLMGWCAAAGQAATAEHHSWKDLLFSDSSAGGWLLAALLFAWQFPHFMSLSHLIRDDYKNAGHKMLAWTNPARNARVALRYSLAMFPICAGLYWAGIVNQAFLAISTVCNMWMTRDAVRFWRKQGAGGSARGLFWASVWQLPLVLVGALVCKSRVWDGFFGSGGMDEEKKLFDNRDQDGLFRGAGGGANDLMMVGVDGEGKPIMVKKKEMHDINLAMMGFKRPS